MCSLCSAGRQRAQPSKPQLPCSPWLSAIPSGLSPCPGSYLLAVSKAQLQEQGEGSPCEWQAEREAETLKRERRQPQHYCVEPAASPRALHQHLTHDSHCWGRFAAAALVIEGAVQSWAGVAHHGQPERAGNTPSGSARQWGFGGAGLVLERGCGEDGVFLCAGSC